MVGQSDGLPMMIATGLAAMHALSPAPAETKAPYRGRRSRQASGYDPLTMSAHRGAAPLGNYRDGKGKPGQDEDDAGRAGAPAVRPGSVRRSGAAYRAARAEYP